MKTLFKYTVGIAFYLFTAFILYFLAMALTLEINDVKVFIGWMSCAIFYESLSSFESWINKQNKK